MTEDRQLDIQTKRRVATAKWMITARWFYPFGVLFIGLLTKNVSQSNVYFSYVSMISLFVSFFIINFALWLMIKKVVVKFSSLLLNLACHGIIISELVFFILIMHLAGGVESISNIFFFLPIVGASLIFGAKGSIITALGSGLIINLLVAAEYFNIIPHVPRYNALTIEFTELSIGLTKTLTNSIFFMIVGLFSGYSAKMIFHHEVSLAEEAQRLDEQTNRLKKQEAELTAANGKLNEKINELATFQKLAVDRELRMMELKEKLIKLTAEKIS